MKVLLNDGLQSEGLRIFENAGIEIDTTKKDPQELAKVIGDFDALIVRSATKVTREVIEAGAKGKLKIVGRAGVGYDNIDVEAANEKGIVIKIAPNGSTNAVAELAIALMLCVSRNIPQAHRSLSKGIWEKKKFKGTELSSKTLGIVGCGKIGQRVADLARRGFEMEVLGYDICQCAESRVKYVTKEELLTKSDYITIHTGGKCMIICKEDFNSMKPTAYLINTSRGANVDQEALYNALKEKRIAGAALDVYVDEPKKDGSDFTDKLKDLDNVVLSPHLGASTEEGQCETSIEIARVVAGYLLGGDFTNAVNAGETIELEEKRIHTLFVYHRDVPGVFASIDRVLAENDINIRANYSRQIGKGGFAISVYVIHQDVKPEIIKVLKQLPNVQDVKT